MPPSECVKRNPRSFSPVRISRIFCCPKSRNSPSLCSQFRLISSSSTAVTSTQEIIAIYGLFGWMNAGEVADIVGYDAIYENLPTEVREQIDENEVQLQTIDTVFAENGLTRDDVSKAKLIYLSYLTDRYSEENFYQRLADCFLAVSEESDLLTYISSAFGVKFSDADRKQFNEYFGGG